MNIHHPLNNPLTALLAKRRGPLDAPAGLWLAIYAYCAIVFGRVGPDSHKVGLVAGALVYALARAGLDAGHLKGWRQGRRLEEMLLVLGHGQLLDGIAAFSLWRTAQVSGVAAALAFGLGILLGDPSVMLGALLGPPLLLCLVAALSYLFSGGAGAWLLLSLILLARFADSPAVFGLVLLATTWVARRRALAPVAAPERRAVRCGGASVHLWSENAIVVRELRREARAASSNRALWSQRHSSVALMVVLFAANLLSGPLLPARLEWNACLLLALALVVQSLRGSLATCPALVGERQCKTLESLALSGLSSADFVDGWAQLGWRTRMKENLWLALAALILGGLGLATIPAHPPECSLYKLPLFSTPVGAFLTLSPWLVALPLATIAGAYAGVVASSMATTEGEASQNCTMFLLSGGLLAVPLWLLTESCWPHNLLVLLSIPLWRSWALNRLTHGGAR